MGDVPAGAIARGDRARQLRSGLAAAVPGLAAKPIVDVALVVEDSASERAYAPQLESAGFALTIREPEWFEHRMFKGREPSVNLHVFSSRCPEVERMVHSRDWLRGDADDRTLYEQTKRGLAAREWAQVQNYADAKSAVIVGIMGSRERVRPHCPSLPISISFRAMPTYEFICPNGHDFEKFFRTISSGEAELPCPACGAMATRKISAGAGLMFKGSGFYITDYGKDGKKDQNAARKATSNGDGGSSPSTSDSSGGSNNDSKSSGDSKSASDSKSSESKPSESTSPKSDSKATDSKPAAAKPTESKPSTPKSSTSSE